MTSTSSLLPICLFRSSFRTEDKFFNSAFTLATWSPTSAFSWSVWWQRVLALRPAALAGCLSACRAWGHYLWSDQSWGWRGTDGSASCYSCPPSPYSHCLSSMCSVILVQSSRIPRTQSKCWCCQLITTQKLLFIFFLLLNFFSNIFLRL